jgi:hypothetical protein
LNDQLALPDPLHGRANLSVIVVRSVPRMTDQLRQIAA